MTNAEIQVGEYVRTKKHGIFKVAEIHKTEYGYYVLSTDTFEAFTIGKGFSHEIKNDIVKHDFNIIKLIEVGDYVKLYSKLGNKEYIDNISSYVCNVGKIDNKSFIELDCGQDGTEYVFNADEIKTIITHEQFKAMEYKVGEEQ